MLPLSPEEQRALRQLSVFRGGFSRAAASHVAGVTLPILAALVSKSLVRRSAVGHYDLHELVRQYAAEKLHDLHAEMEAVSHRQCDYYAQFLYQRQDSLRGSRQREALEDIRSEIENVRLAWRWANTHGRIESIGKALRSLLDIYDIQGWFREGVEMLGLAAAHLRQPNAAEGSLQTERSIMLGQVLAAEGWLCLAAGWYEQGRMALLESLSLVRQFNVYEGAMNPLTTLGMASHLMGEYTTARQLLNESLTIQRDNGDGWGEGWTLGNLGMIALANSGSAQSRRGNSNH